MIPTLEWLPTGVNFLDQTKLPLEETYVLATDYKQVATVIRDMIVRGAPAIGVSAAMGMAIGIDRSTATNLQSLTAEVAVIAKTLAETRPTAVNLFWGIDEIRNLYNGLTAKNTPIPEIKSAVVAKARHMYDEDIAACKQMGANGAYLLPKNGTVLTHCNAGALATCGYGTALGVIRAAIERGHKIDVFADETRPLLQGARLTAWELHEGRHPRHRHLRQHGRPGHEQRPHPGRHRRRRSHRRQRRRRQQDRHLRRRHPRQSARHPLLRRRALVSTLDLDTPTGDLIPIEQRDAREVTHAIGKQMTPNGVAIDNPAFDVTPAKYVTAIITERGVLHGPYEDSIRSMAQMAALEPTLTTI